MGNLSKDLLANFIGKGFMAIFSLAMIPLYIKFLGIEHYGIIGFYLSLQSLLILLDFGLSTTLNREFSKFKNSTSYIYSSKEFLRTVEVVYVILLISAGIVFFCISPILSKHWLNPDSISTQSLENSIVLMGLALLCQSPFVLYSGGFFGLGKQVTLNIILVFFGTLRGIGTILVLKYWSPTLESFFTSYILFWIIQTTCAGIILWKLLPLSNMKPKFNKTIFNDIKKYSMGISGITILVVLLLQSDKIILSKLLSLKEFGIYTVATTIPLSLALVTQPIFNSFFPRFSNAISLKDNHSIVALYHLGSQIMSILIYSIGLIIILFSWEIVFFWTGNYQFADSSKWVIRVLTIGYILNAVNHLPYALQISSGWTKLAFIQNLLAVSILLPSIIISVKFFGVIGAPICWVFINLGFVFIGVQIMHSRLLKTEKYTWYINDNLIPFLVASFVTFLGKCIYNTLSISTLFISIIFIITLCFFTILSTSLSVRQIRNIFLLNIKTLGMQKKEKELC